MPTDPEILNAVEGIYSGAGASLNPDKSPDDAARAFELSSASGVPAQSILQDLPTFENFHKKQLAQQIIDNNDDIAFFISAHPSHGQLIHDDLGSLDEYSRAYRRIAPGGHPLTQFLQGFQEQLQGPEEVKRRAAERWPESLKSWPTAASVATHTLGIPFEMWVAEPFLGLLEGSRKAVKAFGVNAGMGEQDAEKLANDAAGFVEYLVMKPEASFGRLFQGAPSDPLRGEILPPEAKPPRP